MSVREDHCQAGDMTWILNEEQKSIHQDRSKFQTQERINS